MEITIFKNIYDADVPHYITLDKCLERIKVGKSKDRIKEIRNCKDKEKRNKLKNLLPAIVFGGVFNERSKKGLKEHSGLMVLDVDNVDNIEELKTKIIEIPYVVTCFTSPSGNGLKAVVKINPCDAEMHTKIWNEFKNTYDWLELDESGKDVSRVCFESYDPKIYVNFDAKVFNPVIEEKGFNAIERAPLIRLNDDSRIIDLIMSWNWTKDFQEGQRNQHCFELASAFCEYGVSQVNAEGYIINNVVHGDFKESEAKQCIKSAYRTRNFGTKYFEDYKKIDLIKSDLKYGKKEVIKKHGISEEAYEEIKDNYEHIDFWFIDKKGNVKIDNLNFKLFLESNGFRKYYHDDNSKPSFIKVKSNLVEYVTVEAIKDYTLSYLIERQELEVWKYCASYMTLFSDKFLNFLDAIHLKMLSDTKDKSYIAYKNGILEVTKDKSELIGFVDVDGYIWKKQIIDRDFMETKEIENDYKQFISNITNGKPLAIECVIGYLISTYKNKTNNKAVILNDEVITENPEGGTGKGLLIQGLQQIRRVSILDGKSFDDRKSFPYQTVTPETQILVFDDVKKNFDFENKFSLVTEGMTLERKNKDAIKLSVEESPKIVISTNYAIKGDGNSHKRRRHEVEIAQYYGGDKEPIDDFGRQLFSDWNEEDFNRFDNYMIDCLQSYLKLGLVEQQAKNIELRHFISSTANEFYEWCQDDRFPNDIRIDKMESFDQFIEEYPDFKKWLSRKKYNIWVQKWAKFNNLEYMEGKSTSGRWFELLSGEEVIKIEEDEEVPF